MCMRWMRWNHFLDLQQEELKMIQLEGVESDCINRIAMYVGAGLYATCKDPQAEPISCTNGNRILQLIIEIFFIMKKIRTHLNLQEAARKIQTGVVIRAPLSGCQSDLE